VFCVGVSEPEITNNHNDRETERTFKEKKVLTKKEKKLKRNRPKCMRNHKIVQYP